MDPVYKITAIFSGSGNMRVNSETARLLGIADRKILYLRFGINAMEAKLAISEEPDAAEIMLSQDILHFLKLPLSLRYEARSRRNELIIGPYIGILACVKEQDLESTVNNLSSYVYHYRKINGAILAFSAEGVDTQTHRINGYLYRPEKEDWVKGTFDYPAAIFKKTGIGPSLRNHFRSVLGDAVFNNYIFNKWEAYEWLSPYPRLHACFPETQLYANHPDVMKFLDRWGKIYIKPLYGSQGKNIIRVEKKGKWYFTRLGSADKNEELCFKEHRQFRDFLSGTLEKGKYIIQRSLDLIQDGERAVDFRILLLKGPDGSWQDIGMIARYGIKDSITSNVSTGGSAEAGETAIRKVLQLPDIDAGILRGKMSRIAIDAAKGLENCGINCGNLGVDMALDTAGDIWIIEINNIDPNHTIAIDAGDRQMFYNARLMNMLYAKYLAGFGEEVNGDENPVPVRFPEESDCASGPDAENV